LKDLPAGWRAGFKAALVDPNLTSLRGELAVQTEIIGQLLRRLSDTEARPWGQAVEAFNDLKMATTSKDTDKFKAALAALEQVIRTGADAAASQKEIREELRAVMQERTRTAAAEWRRMADLNVLVTMEEALGLWRALLMAAKEIVTDQGQLRALQERTLKLLPPE
jgi:hypothetical protein